MMAKDMTANESQLLEILRARSFKRGTFTLASGGRASAQETAQIGKMGNMTFD